MIIPSIDIVGGRAVQMVKGDKQGLDCGEPMEVADRLAITGAITVIDTDAAMGKGNNKEIIEKLVHAYPCRVGGGIRDIDAAISWLDAGAEKIIIGTAATPELLSALPKERLAAALDVKAGEIVVEGCRTSTDETVFDRMERLRPYVSEFLVTVIDREGTESGIDLTFVEAVANEAGKQTALTVAGGISTAEELAAIDKLGANGQVGMALHTGKLDLADAIMAPAKSDRLDGLFATIVADEQGQGIGLVYSDMTSVRESVKRKVGAYHSRSRGLWIKGLTSGNTQGLLSIKLDCDRDALLFTVTQTGAGFCHNDTWGCFGEDRGIGKLFRTIEGRRAWAPEGSYTKRLLDDPSLLGQKLVEEARELGEAESKADVVGEAADLIYFTLTAVARAGASLGDVERELHRRSLRVTRQGGDAKRDRS